MRWRRGMEPETKGLTVPQVVARMHTNYLCALCQQDISIVTCAPSIKWREEDPVSHLQEARGIKRVREEEGSWRERSDVRSLLRRYTQTEDIQTISCNNARGLSSMDARSSFQDLSSGVAMAKNVSVMCVTTRDAREVECRKTFGVFWQRRVCACVG